MSSQHETAKLIAVVAAIVLAVVLACGVACFYRRQRCPILPVFVDGRSGRKRRVVVMHSNSLYDDDAASKHQQNPQSPHQRQQLTFVMPPRVKIETSSARGNRRRLLSTVFEYEIPLDPQWEFPRDKSAALNVFSMSS